MNYISKIGNLTPMGRFLKMTGAIKCGPLHRQGDHFAFCYQPRPWHPVWLLEIGLLAPLIALDASCRSVARFVRRLCHASWMVRAPYAGDPGFPSEGHGYWYPFYGGRRYVPRYTQGHDPDRLRLHRSLDFCFPDQAACGSCCERLNEMLAGHTVR